MLKKVSLYFLGWKTVICLLAILSVFCLPLQTRFTPIFSLPQKLPYLIWIWGNFDGVHYAEIAFRGYQNLEQPFFPLYPLLIRTLAVVFKLNYFVSGQIISVICFILGLWIMGKLLQVDRAGKLFDLLFLIILFFPTAFFYSAVYNDALFFLLATLCLYKARLKKWSWAGVYGGLATLARLNGLCLFPFLIAEYLTANLSVIKSWRLFLAKKNYWRNFQKLFSVRWCWFFLIPACFCAYLGYVNWQFGSWEKVFSSMEIWGQNRLTFPLQVVWRYLKIIFLYPNFTAFTYYVALLEFVFFLWYCWLLLFSWKKIRLGYWLFFFFSILVPALTGTFQGMPRYGLHLYPLFLSTVLFLKSKQWFVRIIYFVFCALLTIFYVAFFTRGYFVA